MNSPFTGGKVSLQKEKRTFEFRKEQFEIVYHYYVCCDTNEQFTDTALDELNINQVYNQYRILQGLPFPDEIKIIREKYGLSAAKMSEILGFGVNMYAKYESGEIPNTSNGRMIKSCDNPQVFLTYFNNAINQIAEKDKENIKKKIDKALVRTSNSGIEWFSLGETERSALTGYVQPSLEKARHMILFFAEQCQPFITKLNKLLFYADFINYKKTGFSISGLSYRAIPYGPVPQRYSGLIESSSDVIEKEIAGDGEKIVPKLSVEFDKTLFSQLELETLSLVFHKFRNTSVKSIIEISHKEKAWIENKDQKALIPYDYAFDIEAL